MKLAASNLTYASGPTCSFPAFTKISWALTISIVIGITVGIVTIPASARGIVDTRSIADEEQGDNWLTNGRTYSERQFSPLSAIHAGNVQHLGLAWYLDLPRQRSLQASPLAVDGVLYFSGTNGWVFAVDARTGRLLWQFDPDLSAHPVRTRGAIFRANRGVAFWRGKVYVGTADGRLVALNAATGKEVWATQTFDEPNMQKNISGAPRAFNGKVIIGNGGYDTTRGFVTAYDAETGHKVWRFHTVPGDPAKGFESEAMARAAKTWPAEWWKQGGHGVAWDSMVYDPAFNRVYIGTATASGAKLQGDRLYSSSIVALDADTGHYVWHYQVNPGEALDYDPNYDATNQIILGDLNIAGKPRQVLMQAPKNGFFYVIDRTSGNLISAEKIGKVTWTDHIDIKTGRPVKIDQLKGKDGTVLIWPSAFGIHDWQAMSFHPRNGLVYIPTTQLGMWISGSSGGFGTSEPGEGIGGLLAWDPVAQRKRWEIHYEDCFWNGGVLSTAGNLVFQGTGRGQLLAYDAQTGKKLWSFDAGLGINAAPMTFAVDGVQYISVLVGYGGTANASKLADYGWRFNEQPRRLLTFALGQRTQLPPSNPPRFQVKAVDDPTLTIDATAAAKGAKAYARCGGCHGTNLENYASIAPDLRESGLALNWEAFNAVVREGVLAAAGMPKFDELSEDEAHAIFIYVRQRARETTQVGH
jgi:quinohemoprotein ethanol dehydrogenase